MCVELRFEMGTEDFKLRFIAYLVTGMSSLYLILTLFLWGAFQVLINLVGNACKFTHVGYIAVDVSIVCDKCHQDLKTGERQCSLCSAIPQAVTCSNGPAQTGSSLEVETALQSAYRDPGSPEAIFVHNASNGLRRLRAVENIRAHMSICETYKDLVMDKVSSADFSLETNSDPIVADSEVDPPVFDGTYKRKREYAQESEADQVMVTQSLYEGEPMERRHPSCSTSKGDVSSNHNHINADYNGQDESDEDMMVEKPRTVRWFRFSVIDTGIG